jgi:dTDP-4-dehydrorhamnose reductase
MTIAQTLISEPDKGGTYHFSGSPDTSWAGFARNIFTAANRAVTIEEIPTSAYPTPARRPLNSRLDCSSLTSQFGITRPDWRVATDQIVKTLI